MITLVSGATTYPRDAAVGHLVVPRQWNDPAKLNLTPGQWAMDNGCFVGFDPGAYMRMLEAFAGQPACLWCVVPDVVGDAAATLRLWPFWSRIVRACGHPLAFVAQDGLTANRVPWDEMDCLFVGGSTAYKESPEAATLCGVAKARGKWVHWGRVNGRRRYQMALRAGADSIDGTGFSIAPDTNIPKVVTWTADYQRQPTLLAVGDRDDD